MATEPSPPSRLPDPFREGIASGWKVIDASSLTADATFEADVAIVGSGAGGGTVAEILSDAGLKVMIVEEGPLATSSDFHMLESEAYPQLYQESASRKTKDKAITILQGRCVGGGTTVNWTSSFRTPAATLDYWAREFAITGFGSADLAPWFERMEARLGIAPWAVAPNANNEALRRGAHALGLSSGVIRRNVRGCWNLGYCGMGCPTNAKQSMLVTTIPAALSHGATLLTRTRAWKLERADDRIASLSCIGLDQSGTDPTERRINVRAKTFVAAAGAIGTPCAAQAQRRPRSSRSRRQANVSPSDGGVDGAHARSRRRFRRCTADGLFGSFPRFAAVRRTDRLQAGSTAVASGPRGDDATRLRRSQCALDARVPAHASRDRADARRV
jgi:choline dehydrogenase-like flavoprotein